MPSFQRFFPHHRNRQIGFTLIELMITVAIVGILAAIAYPNYQEYVYRSRRVEGQSLLHDAAARQERFRAQNGVYATDLSKLNMPLTSENGYYTLSDDSGTSTNYKLKATRAGAQAGDKKCGDFTLDASGVKGMAGGTRSASDCWR
ncbi:type IV pilin protein [Corticibacter populi]|uniref:Type IV pilin protein n=1 Tax=Corticibacter populi TaxID=1550736 RepID=A0A3M6QYM1_9BURK|nr:type IV pilin protein [Corticibacter populi]RMX07993.1 type IV pilin protein [Corticibacter populi]RZS35235.1 type IV pilus assembly protein PilE [Corticibacter populi]